MNAFGYTALTANLEANLFRREWIDIYATAAAIEAHVSVDERENGIITAETDVFAGEKFRAALANDDVTGDDHFATELFNTKPLTDAIAAVLNTALSFFVSHDL